MIYYDLELFVIAAPDPAVASPRECTGQEVSIIRMLTISIEIIKSD